jgi:chaperone BCS1
MSDEEFVKNYNVGSEKSMIILLEDLDVLFNLRENALAQTSKTKNLLSFDTLINTIAGIKRNDGIFLIITVNDISRCDPALIRPGRCDMKIEVGPLDRKGREFIARNILKGYPELIESIILTGEGKVAAEFENDCIELALREFYKDREKSLTLTA